MKILLNGATGGTNFGDFLFAKIFHEKVVSLVGEENVFWYDSRYCLSTFFKKHLKCNSRKHKLSDIDALVCISGGYFCGNDKSWKNYVIRYLMYFHLCIRCILRRIPIAIIGVEVAKSKSKIIDKIQRFICRRAKIVVVRNSESLETLVKYGVDSGICTSDTAHIITTGFFSTCDVKDDIMKLEGKRLFFHVQPSYMDVAEKLVPVINKFIKLHPEYSVVLGTDQYCQTYDFLEEFAKQISANVVINRFDNPVDLCKVLSVMDLIITPKLHVGIVGATLSKSVVSFSIHSEKTSRFYHQLGEQGRSMSMVDFAEDKAINMLEKYYAKNLYVDEKIIKLAESNLDYLGKFIDNLSH